MAARIETMLREEREIAPERLDNETNGATVEADPTLLARARNLLDNAGVHTGGAERLRERLVLETDSAHEATERGVAFRVVEVSSGRE